MDAEGLEYIYNYWVLKRRASFNKPLLAAKSDDASDLLNKNQEQVDQEKMRMFVQLRQDLERVSVEETSYRFVERDNDCDSSCTKVSIFLLKIRLKVSRHAVY